MTQSIQTIPFNVDELRERLQEMSDTKTGLRTFGQAAQRMVSPNANPGQPPPGVFVIQLGEARLEWK
jgi:hypothetical protein